MSWIVAESLNRLLTQLSELAPNRSRASDGSIGDASHEDGNKSNNHPCNLSWKTPEENRDDMRRHHREELYADRGPSVTVS